jgi:hypothetical protein
MKVHLNEDECDLRGERHMSLLLAARVTFALKRNEWEKQRTMFAGMWLFTKGGEVVRPRT